MLKTSTKTTHDRLALVLADPTIQSKVTLAVSRSSWRVSGALPADHLIDRLFMDKALMGFMAVLKSAPSFGEGLTIALEMTEGCATIEAALAKFVA